MPPSQTLRMRARARTVALIPAPRAINGVRGSIPTAREAGDSGCLPLSPQPAVADTRTLSCSGVLLPPRPSPDPGNYGVIEFRETDPKDKAGVSSRQARGLISVFS